MPYYRWKGITETGASCAGRLQASSPEQVQMILLQKKIALLTAKKTIWSLSIFSYLAQRGQSSVSLNLVQLFFHNCGVLLSSGVDLLGVLRATALSFSKTKLKDNINHAIEMISQGKPFHEALSSCPYAFPPLAITVIATAEETGTLALSSAHLAQTLEQQQALRHKIRRALATPVITFFTAIIVSGVVLVCVVPSLEATLSSMGAQLPASTAFLFRLSKIIRIQEALLALPVFGMFVLLIFYGVKKCAFLGRIMLKIPLIGSLLLQQISISFLHMLLLYLRAGASLSKGLYNCSQQIPSRLGRTAARELYQKLTEGKAFDVILDDYPELFSAHTRTLVQVGMKSGSLIEALEKALLLSQDDVQRKIDLLVTLVNPCAMIMLALLILGLLLMLYLPIFTLALLPSW